MDYEDEDGDESLDGEEEVRVIAGRSLGDLVMKLGDKVPHTYIHSYIYTYILRNRMQV